MNRSVKLLDCTLRDGGYVNNWEFGNGSMICIYDRLVSAQVDFIEVGFLDDRNAFDMNRSIQPNTECYANVLANANTGKVTTLAMIDYGTCSIDNIEPRDKTILDGIRVIFKKENMYKAADFGKQLIEKGYDVFLQLVSITDYQEEDIKSLANYIQPIMPIAVSIVDTYGLMHKEQVYEYFQMLDKWLPKGVAIGYHSHNNFQLAYSNTISVLDLDTERNIVLDGTLYGMGKSAGNAPIELLAMHLNEVCEKHYDVNQMLEAINTNILPIYQKHYWGYSMFFYIAAKNDCHPNYVKYLMDKNTLSIKDVDEILGRISEKYRLRYNKEYIETIYGEYILEAIDDKECVSELKGILGQKEILLIGPGKSAVNHIDSIKKYISDHHPVVITTNYIPDNLDIDFVFISNPVRYSLLLPKINSSGVKVIGTSNVTTVNAPFDYTVRYDLLISKKTIWDNSLAIMLNLLKKINIERVALAGFDGFVKDPESNYVDLDFDLSRDYEYLSSVNLCMTQMIRDFRKILDIVFVTRSIYEKEECLERQGSYTGTDV